MKHILFSFSLLIGVGVIPSIAQQKTACTPPLIVASGAATICSGQSATLGVIASGGVSPYTYVWTPAGSLVGSNNSNPVASPTITTTYTIVVTDNSCPTSSLPDSVTVTVTTLTVTAAASPSTICIGQSTILTASGGVTYSWWNTGQTTTNPVTVSPTSTTTYTVVGTSAGGCNDTNTVLVTVDTPTVTATASSSTLCSGQNTTLTASGGSTYSWWNTGQTTTNPVMVSPTGTITYTVVGTSAGGCNDTNTVLVTVNTTPTVTATAFPSTICNGDSTTLTASGGSTYSWWNTGQPSTTNPVTVSPTGTITYTVVGTSASGCDDTNTVVVTVNPTPTVTATASPSAVCVGQSTTLTASGGGTYSWGNTGQPSTTNPVTVSPIANITYTVTETNGFGCTNTTTVAISVGPALAPTITGPASICSGNTTTLDAGSGYTGYLWSPTPAVTQTITATTQGVYSVTVTDATGCSGSGSFSLTVNPTPTVAITGTPAATICSGTTATLDAGSGYTGYLWSPGNAITQTITTTTSGIYSVTVTNGGCSASASFSLTVNPSPTVTITGLPAAAICSGNTATLDAGSGYTSYLWSPTPAATQTITATTQGVYSVIVTDANGCSGSGTFSLTVNPNPNAIATSYPSTICIGSNTTLTGTGGTGYVWSPPVNSATQVAVVTPTSTGTFSYTVTVTDANGCNAIATTTVIVLPLVNAAVSGITTICMGEQTTLTATGGGTYSWVPGAIPTPTITVNTTSCYTVTVSNGTCSDDTTVCVTVNALPSAVATAASYSITVGNQTTLTATGTGTYTWSPTTGLSCSTCPNPTANPTVTTTYTLTITNANGCTAMDTVIVNVMNDCGALWVPTAFSPNNDAKNDFVTVKSKCIETIDFSIYNRWGQLVYHTTDISIVNNSNAGWDGKHNGKECNSAVYYYILNVKLLPAHDLVEMKGNVSLIR